MNRASWIFVGVFGTFASAWLGLAYFPNLQLKDLQASRDEVTGQLYPSPYSGSEMAGRAIYVREGCMYCHSQQVRGGKYNADLRRGWGMRRSHPQDYIFDYPQLLGTMRTGPDLANIGIRQTSVEWHLKHLYDPQMTSPGSIMPPYAYLFETRKIEGQPSADALELEDGWKLDDPSLQIVPTREVLDLVAYLLSLRQDYEVSPMSRETLPETQQ